VSIPSGIGRGVENTLALDVCSLMPIWMARWIWRLLTVTLMKPFATSAETLAMRNRRNFFLNQGGGKFRDVAGQVGGGFESPRVGRGLAFGDFDRDGDLDILMTTNNGPAYLYRNDQTANPRSIRFRLRGTKSNRDAIGASSAFSTKGKRSLGLSTAARAISLNRNCRNVRSRFAR